MSHLGYFQGKGGKYIKNTFTSMSTIFQVEVEEIETAWKLECFPNGKQKIGEKNSFPYSKFL